MVFEDSTNCLFWLLRDEWHLTSSIYKGGWYSFILHLDLGIEYLPIESGAVFKVYKITNNKKWLLTRLKYGI